MLPSKREHDMEDGIDPILLENHEAEHGFYPDYTE